MGTLTIVDMRYILLLLAIGIASCSSKQSFKEISKSEFGDQWPFTVEKGILECIPQKKVDGLPENSMNAIIFTVGATQYAVNGAATAKAGENGYQEIIEIMRDDESIGGGAKMSIQPIIDEGLKICNN